MGTASVIRGFHPKLKPLARCKRGTAKPAKKRTKRTHRNGFLTHAFKPFWGITFGAWNATEQAFFNALQNLCDFQGWAIPDVSGLAFPENMTSALSTLNKNTEGTVCLLVQDKENLPLLATVKTFDTQYRLYYIPVRPMVKLRELPQMQGQYRIFKGIFFYLYHIVGVPYFSEGGYLDNTYDALKDWISDIEEDDEDSVQFYQKQLKELKAMKAGADALLPEVKTPCSLAEFNSAIKDFQVKDSYDSQLLEMAVEWGKLYQDYPDRNIKDRMHYELQETDGADQIYWEQYLSFYWSGEDCLQDNLFDMVNCELQEMGYQEEPVAIRFFDTPQEVKGHDFDFEARFFALVNRLTELLNDLDYEEPDK